MAIIYGVPDTQGEPEGSGQCRRYPRQDGGNQMIGPNN